MSIDIRCPEHLESARQFAKTINDNAVKTLEDCLMRLQRRADWVTVLVKDFAPYSFYFTIYNAAGEQMLCGGIIYHGPGQPGDGSAPAFSVSMGGSEPRWEIHT